MVINTIQARGVRMAAKTILDDYGEEKRIVKVI